MYPIDKYKFYTDDPKNPTKIYAVSTYAGRTVRGVAKCDPRDKFSMQQGKELAAARCELKVAQKRKARAIRLFAEATARKAQALKYADKMAQYAADADNAAINAEDRINTLLEKM